MNYDLDISQNFSEIEEREENVEITSQKDFTLYSELASSGYSTLMIDSEQEDNDDIATVKVSVVKDEVYHSDCEINQKEDKSKAIKITRNQMTLKQRSTDEIRDFQRQEVERYKNPHLPYTYITIHDGIPVSSVVAPILKKPPTSTSNKPREHVMLKQDRPYFVTILCLARDAAARLYEGMGTRADICDLLKDSQYINENLTDPQVHLLNYMKINNVVSGALDRLHYEKDPCIKYDSKKKMWVYLHKNRSLDYWSIYHIYNFLLEMNSQDVREDDSDSKRSSTINKMKESIEHKLRFDMNMKNIIRFNKEDEEIDNDNNSQRNSKGILSRIKCSIY